MTHRRRPDPSSRSRRLLSLAKRAKRRAQAKAAALARVERRERELRERLRRQLDELEKRQRERDAKSGRRDCASSGGPEAPADGDRASEPAAASRRGGRRRGAGRKPKGLRALMPHRTRPRIERRNPVHVTTRLMLGLPSLRQPGARQVIESCLCIACERFGVRVVHYSIQTNHLHLIVECVDREALSKAMQGMLVRFAKNLNKHWDRKGRVFADRYFAREVRSLKAIRNVIRYVLFNAQHHGVRVEGPLDECSSARWLDGWARPPAMPPGPRTPVTCVPARQWALRIGWKEKIGPLSFDEPWSIPREAELHTSPAGVGRR